MRTSVEAETLRKKLYKKFQTLIHEDKFTAAMDNVLQALENECDECAVMQEEEKVKFLENMIAQRRGSYKAVISTGASLTSIMKDAISDPKKIKDQLEAKVDRPAMIDEDFFEKILNEKIDNFNEWAAKQM